MINNIAHTRSSIDRICVSSKKARSDLAFLYMREEDTIPLDQAGDLAVVIGMLSIIIENLNFINNQTDHYFLSCAENINNLIVESDDFLNVFEKEKFAYQTPIL